MHSVNFKTHIYTSSFKLKTLLNIKYSQLFQIIFFNYGRLLFFPDSLLDLIRDGMNEYGHCRIKKTITTIWITKANSTFVRKLFPQQILIPLALNFRNFQFFTFYYPRTPRITNTNTVFILCAVKQWRSR